MQDDHLHSPTARPVQHGGSSTSTFGCPDGEYLNNNKNDAAAVAVAVETDSLLDKTMQQESTWAAATSNHTVAVGAPTAPGDSRTDEPVVVLVVPSPHNSTTTVYRIPIDPPSCQVKEEEEEDPREASIPTAAMATATAATTTTTTTTAAAAAAAATTTTVGLAAPSARIRMDPPSSYDIYTKDDHPKKVSLYGAPTEESSVTTSNDDSVDKDKDKNHCQKAATLCTTPMVAVTSNRQTTTLSAPMVAVTPSPQQRPSSAASLPPVQKFQPIANPYKNVKRPLSFSVDQSKNGICSQNSNDSATTVRFQPGPTRSLLPMLDSKPPAIQEQAKINNNIKNCSNIDSREAAITDATGNNNSDISDKKLATQPFPTICLDIGVDCIISDLEVAANPQQFAAATNNKMDWEMDEDASSSSKMDIACVHPRPSSLKPDDSNAGGSGSVGSFASSPVAGATTTTSSSSSSSEPSEITFDFSFEITNQLPPVRKKNNTKSILEQNQDFFETLGSLRHSTGAMGKIELLDPLHKYCKQLGRVYFRSFAWKRMEFKVGSTVFLDSRRTQCSLITSIFQATKSFMGDGYVYNADDESKQSTSVVSRSQSIRSCELQKRGNAYFTAIALQCKRRVRGKRTGPTKRYSTKYSDWIDPPEWLHNPGLNIEKANVDLEGEALMLQNFINEHGIHETGWSKHACPRQVHFLSKLGAELKRKHKKNKIPFSYTDDSSDDSDGFDSDSRKKLHFFKTTTTKKQRLITEENISTSGSSFTNPEGSSHPDDEGNQNALDHEDCASWEGSDDDNSDEDPGDSDSRNSASISRKGKNEKQKSKKQKQCKDDDRTDFNKHRMVIDADLSDLEESVYCSEQAEREKVLRMLAPFKKHFPELQHEIEKAHLTLDDLVEKEYIDDVSPHQYHTKVETKRKLEGAKQKLGISAFRQLQEIVAAEVVENPQRDIIVNAPCGFGKSMCFMVPAVLFGGITIVVEPLRALIESLHNELMRKSIPCERLLTIDEAQKSNKLAACDRLDELAIVGRDNNKTLVIVTTPEQIFKDNAMRKLTKLYELGKLRRIVVDEFDLCMEESMKGSVDSREAYACIVPQIRKYLPEVSTMFLSATASPNVVTLVASHGRRASEPKPKLYIHCNPLPENHFYLVERKTSLVEASKRIKEILVEYGKPEAKAICYFVGRQITFEFHKFLEQLGISSDVFVGADNLDEKKKNSQILKDFKGKKIQILCANSALGRGVDDLPKNVRFCFHIQMPESLDEYLQQTGRAGRDGGLTYCYMFYRYEDRTRIKKARLGRRYDSLKEKELETKLDTVLAYAWNGSLCRRQGLAKCTLVRNSDEVSCKSKGRTLCDNCLVKDGISKESKDDTLVDITPAVLKLLHRAKAEFQGLDKTSMAEKKRDEVVVWHKVVGVMKESSQNSKEKALFTFMRAGGEDYSSIRDFYNYMSNMFDRDERKLSIMERKEKSRPNLVDDMIQRLLGRRIQLQAPLHLRLCCEKSKLKCTTTTQSCTNFLDRSFHQIPILVQYALQQLQNSGQRHTENQNIRNVVLGLSEARAANGNIDRKDTLEKACRQLAKSRSLRSLNFDLLAAAETTGYGIYWTATASKDGDLELCPPEPARDRRIFRKFRADRFLTVRVKKDIDKKAVLELLSGDGIAKGACKGVLFGRKYRYVWCKKYKDPQQFVLFAEEGPGLTPISVHTILDWAMPRALNKTLSVAKRLKRMKLYFSKTSPTAILSVGSVSILPNFELGNTFAEIDGCGLISREALDLVWEKYQKNLPLEKQAAESICPYTGFQGRLGGFKGTWILDRALGDGVVVQCRKSQHKINVYQSCLVTDERMLPVRSKINCDDHNIMEVSTWDKDPAPATLNVRIIQQLEHFGVPWEFFDTHCLQPALKELDGLSGSGDDSRRAWVKHLREKQNNGILKESTDSRHCLLMECATVGLSDPEIRRYKRKLVSRMFQSLQSKANYRLAGCVYLRMYGDHTMLLKRGEAFVACDSFDKSTEDIIAMRSPSYFAGDLRRLHIVSLGEIKVRAETTRSNFRLPYELIRNAEQTYDFFCQLRNCLVLSNMGDRSEADRMSGGDYDGDLAWVSWNRDLVSQIHKGENPAEDTSHIRDEPSRTGLTSAWIEENRHNEILYALESRLHHVHLGRLSKQLDAVIDADGFNSEKARRLGQASFLQVDVPDTPLLKRREQDKLSQGISTPDWAVTNGHVGTDRSYKSKKVLGRLNRALREKMAVVIGGMDTAAKDLDLDGRITEVVDGFRQDELYDNFLDKMKDAVDCYLCDIAQYHAQNSFNHGNAGKLEDDEEKLEAFAKLDDWKTAYFDRKRRELMGSEGWLESSNPDIRRLFGRNGCAEIRRDLRAALLYMAGWEKHQTWSVKREQTSIGVQYENSGGPMEFVWGVAGKELFCLFGQDKNSLLLNSSVEPVFCGNA
ncbi:hypothetical protein ACA910_007257 [Epithemia clementina (nom. ined.)]